MEYLTPFSSAAEPGQESLLVRSHVGGRLGRGWHCCLDRRGGNRCRGRGRSRGCLDGCRGGDCGCSTFRTLVDDLVDLGGVHARATRAGTGAGDRHQGASLGRTCGSTSLSHRADQLVPGAASDIPLGLALRVELRLLHDERDLHDPLRPPVAVSRGSVRAGDGLLLDVSVGDRSGNEAYVGGALLELQRRTATNRRLGEEVIERSRSGRGSCRNRRLRRELVAVALRDLLRGVTTGVLLRLARELRLAGELTVRVGHIILLSLSITDSVII